MDDSSNTTPRNRVSVTVNGHPEAIIEEDPMFWFIDGRKFFKSETTLDQAIETTYGKETLEPTQEPEPMQPNKPTAPPTPPTKEPPRRRHMGILYAIIGVSAFAILLFATNPSKARHEEKVQEVVDDYMNRQLNDAPDSFTQIGMSIGQLISKSIIKNIIAQRFKVDNYGVMSVGKISLDSEPHIVTIGILGTVIPLIGATDIESEVDKKSQDDDFTNSIDESLEIPEEEE